MKFKKLLSFVAAAAMACTAMLGSMTITSFAASTAGKLKYEVTSGTLNIWCEEEGGAAMDNYTAGRNTPWYRSRNSITKVVIGDGVKSVGNYAFHNYFSNITEIVIGSDVTSIGDYAFNLNGTGNATALKKVTMSDNITSIGEKAFYKCTGLTTIQTTATAEVQQQATDESGNLLYIDSESGADTTVAEGNEPKMETVTANVQGLPSKLQTIGDYAFQNNSALESVTSLPSSVTSIGQYAFADCSKIFNNENGITINATIGAYAFQNCRALKKVSCESRVEAIPNYAFDGCTGLTDFSAYANLKTIGDYAFRGCTALTGSMWNAIYQGGRGRLEKIGSYAFQNCAAMTTIGPFSGSLNSVGSYAFEGIGITSVNVPSTWTTIGSNVFSRCSSLTEATLPDNMTAIPSGMFSRTAITKIKIPSGVTSIGSLAFYSCQSLANVEFTSYKLEEVGTNAFGACTALTSLMLPSTVKKLGASAFDGSGLTSFAVPPAVTEIPDTLFQNCTALTSVSLPDDITRMGVNVFKGATSLSEVVLPKNLETVSGNTFSGSGLEKITAHPESTVFSTDSNGVLYNFDQTELIAYPAGRYYSSFTVPSTVETIKANAFANATNLTSISFPTGSSAKLATIENSAFSGCTGLRSVTIPITVKEIGTSAFSGCTAMTSLTFTGYNSTSETSKSNCATIGNSAFRGCTALTAVTTPNSLTSIGNNAFSGCTKLATLTLNNGLESIGDSAFEGDTAITAINIPDSVTALGQKAFKGCSAAATLKISKNLEEIKMETFHSCTSLTSAIIPTGVKTLANSIFYGCTGLVEANIPNSVTTMGTYMFHNCTSLEKAVVSNKITTVQNNTFYGCTNPELNIYLLGTIATAQSSGLQNVKGTIYVYDDTSYTTVSSRKPSTATIKYGANFTQLKEKLAEVAEMDLESYTDGTSSVLASAVTMAESVIANYAANQNQADAAVEAIDKSIANLIAADNKAAFAELADKIAEAEKLIASDYQEASYAKLTEAIEAAKQLDSKELVGPIKKSIRAISESVDSLVPSYAYPDVIKEVMQGAYETFLEGTATAKMAGAEKVKVTFDMTPNCAYNQMTEFKFKASVNSAETAEQSQKGSGWPANGTKGHTATFTLDNPLKEGDQYWFYGYTYNWSKHVFSVTQVELLNSDDEVIFSTKDIVVPNGDLIAAVEAAKTVDTTGADADKVAELEKAIKAAETIIAKKLPLVSEMNVAKDSVEKAVKALKGDEPTPPHSSNPTDSNPTDSNPTEPPSVTKPSVATTTGSKATRSPEAVKKDKAAAKKAMKQAKITKLTAKSKAKKKINVTWKKVKKATGYQVQVSNKKNFKKVIFKKDLKKTKLTIKSKKIKSKKTYYVRVRAYATYKDADNKTVKVYSKWNKKLRKVKVK